MSTSLKHKQMMEEVIVFLCSRFPKAFSQERSGIRPLKKTFLKISFMSWDMMALDIQLEEL